jgi:acyl-CoA synthetase (NDP forming)
MTNSTEHELTRLFRPRSVAILGVSDKPGKLGTVVLENLIANGFSGDIFPVHATLPEIRGVRCVSDPSSLPPGVDVAFVALPAAVTVEAIEALARAGVKNAIIGSAGYAEGGDAEGVARQAALSEIASRAGIRLIGPNCNGIYAAHSDTSIGFNTGHGRKIAKGRLAILSHSGAMFDIMARQLEKLGDGLSLFVSAGNEAHLDILDYLDYALQDTDTRAIALLLDALPSADRFRALARRARDLGKPIVALKLGVSDQGAEAATAHSSRLVGNASAYQAFFTACGVPTVKSIEGLITAGALLARHGFRQGGIAGFSTSGAGAALIADMADRHRITVPRYDEPDIAAASEYLRYQTLVNPTDIGSLAGISGLPGVLDSIFSKADVAALVALMHSIPAPNRRTLIAAFQAAGDSHNVPLVLLAPGGFPADEVENYAAAGFLISDGTDCLFEAVAALLTPQPDVIGTAETTPSASPPIELNGAQLLNEPASLALLARFGVPIAPTIECNDAESAVNAAEGMGYPVVLKGVIEGVAHKTEAGLVHLGLMDATAVRAAYQRLPVANAIVQRHCKGDIEVMIGVTRSVDVGLVLTAGLGGVFVEALRQTVSWALPVDRGAIEAGLAEGALGRILASSRWKHQHARGALVDALLAMQAFAMAAGDRLEAAEINPLLLGPDGAVAVDGLVIPVNMHA